MWKPRKRKKAIGLTAMRSIDRYIGIPLCALASVYLKLQPTRRAQPAEKPRRVLFIELSEMGSTILAQPAMRLARERLNADIYFAIFAENAESLTLTEFVAPANIFTIDCHSLWSLLAGTIRFLIWARRNAIDAVVDLELFSRYSGLLTGLSGAPHRVGFYRFHNEGLYRGEMLTRRVAYNPHIHIAKNFIALVNSLTCADVELPYSKSLISDEQMRVTLPQSGHDARKAMSSRIGSLFPHLDLWRYRIVLVNPKSSQLLPQRQWSAECYAKLAGRLLNAHGDLVVLLTGAEYDRHDIENLASRIAHPRCHSFAGRARLAELPALFALAAAMVTNDSGPAHFAAASGLPTIVLFGPETPNLYRPLGTASVIYAGLACSPCVAASNHRRTPCTDNICMQAISVDSVFAAVDRALTRPDKAEAEPSLS